LFANNIIATDFGYCFADCNSLTGPAPALWRRTNVRYYSSCFLNCTNLSNYDDIPAGWK